MRSSIMPVVSYLAVLVVLSACGGDSLTGTTSDPPHSPVKLAFVTKPSAALAGAPMDAPIKVAVVDADGRIVHSASAQITVALAPVSNGATLSGTITATSVQGVASFTDLSVSTSGTAYRLTASSPALSPATSAPFDVMLRFASISAGGAHTCGLTVDSTAYCWGDNSGGRLGDGTTMTRSVPTLVAGGLKFAAISTGSPHSCALTASGVAYCWGDNGVGELGVGADVPNAIAPMPVVGGIVFASIVAGWHSCGLTADGTAYCWGDGGYALGAGGALANPIMTEPTQVQGAYTFTSITSGLGFTCGVTTSGDGYCAGNDPHGELGDSATTLTDSMVAVAGGLHFTSIDAGAEFACGATSDGEVWCWGRNDSQQLGDPDVADFSSVPVQVSGGHIFTSFSVGGMHACGIATDGETYCWGGGMYGELGDGQAHLSSTPVRVVSGVHFTSIDAGPYHTCGIATDGFAYCWGYNGDGELGIGAIDDITTAPARVAPAGP